MLDLTQYSDDELSMHVFNNEYFYNERHNTDYLLALCNEEFIFTQEQKDVLLVDLLDDKEEVEQ